MPPLKGLDREQLNKLDKEMLIELLLNALSRVGGFPHLQIEPACFCHCYYSLAFPHFTSSHIRLTILANSIKEATNMA